MPQSPRLALTDARLAKISREDARRLLQAISERTRKGSCVHLDAAADHTKRAMEELAAWQATRRGDAGLPLPSRLGTDQPESQ